MEVIRMSERGWGERKKGSGLKASLGVGVAAYRWQEETEELSQKEEEQSGVLGEQGRGKRSQIFRRDGEIRQCLSDSA